MGTNNPNATATANKIENSSVTLSGYAMPAVILNYIIVEAVDAKGFLVRYGYAVDSKSIAYLKKIGLTELQINGELYPDIYGLMPKGYNNNMITAAEHALGNNISPYISASSNLPNGAGGFSGKKIFISIEEIKKSGGKIITSSELIRELKEYSSSHPHLKGRIDTLIKAITDVEGETLIHSKKIPASAIYSPREYGQIKLIAGAGRVLGLVAIVFTAYDIKTASEKSIKVHSIKPLADQTAISASSWASARAGAAFGMGVGAGVGIESGPGMLITGLIGGIIFGIGGYYGAEWALNH